jgi:hypothetical protein
MQKLTDFPVEKIKIKYIKQGDYGATLNICNDKNEMFIADFGEFDTLFGLSMLKSDKIANPKAKLELEIGEEGQRTEHQQKTYEKIMEIRKHIIDEFVARKDDKKPSNMNDEQYTAEDMEQILVNPLQPKRGKKKKKNPITGKEEFPIYPGKLKLSFKFGKTNGEDDNSKFHEFYDPTKPEGKRGNKLFYDEDTKPMSIKVDDMTDVIPPRSRVRVWATLPYIHVSELDGRGLRTAYMTFQPISIKRISTNSTVDLPPTIGELESAYDNFDTSATSEDWARLNTPITPSEAKLAGDEYLKTMLESSKINEEVEDSADEDESEAADDDSDNESVKSAASIKAKKAAAATTEAVKSVPAAKTTKKK